MKRPEANRYVPALGFRVLTPLYDSVVRLTMKDQKLKTMLADALRVRAGMRILDVGCGPGTLAIALSGAHSDAEVVGLDGDAEMLAIARAKAKLANANVHFIEGLATVPPFEPATFDRVVMSLVLHHLVPAQKRDALRAAFELLRPDGEIHVVDWGHARGMLMRAAFLSIQLLDGFPNTVDHVHGRIPEYMREAGFTNVTETHRERTIYGIVSFYRATKAR